MTRHNPREEKRLEPISKSPEEDKGSRAGQSRGSSGRGTPSGRGCDAATVSKRRNARRATVAYNGSGAADLEWAAWFGWTGAARSFRCRPFATPHLADAVIGAIADQILRLGFDHVEVEAQLHQADLVMVGRMRADRQW